MRESAGVLVRDKRGRKQRHLAKQSKIYQPSQRTQNNIQGKCWRWQWCGLWNWLQAALHITRWEAYCYIIAKTKRMGC